MGSFNSPGGVSWLVQGLQASLSADSSVRTAAERALTEAASQDGFGPALAKLVLTPSIAYGYRQLAAVVLKKYVKEHWQEDDKWYTPPTVGPADKNEIKELLLSALGDPQAKIRTAVSVAIAAIAQNDWPQDWPNLMEVLLAAVREKSDYYRMQGALRCLALFAGDMDESHLPAVLPILHPELLAIVASPDHHKDSVRRRAVQIMQSCFGTLGVMSGAYPAETKALIQPMLGPWIEQLIQVLAKPTTSAEADDWGLKMSVLKCLTQVVQDFHKDAARHLPALLEPLWRMFLSCSAVYESAVVKGEADDSGSVDSDGEELSLETLVLQLFEFLLTLVGSIRFHKLLAPSLGELLYFTLRYMSMTELQQESWSSDPNQYVADEDDETYTPRVSGAMLIEEAVEAYEGAALQAVTAAVHRRLSEAAAARSAGQADWWKAREAAILAVGSAADAFLEAEASSPLDVGAFLRSLLQDDLQGPQAGACPFLQGRALWALAKFAKALRGDLALASLQAAAAGLAETSPVPVKVGACRVLAAVCSRTDRATVRPLLSQMYQRLGAMLQSATEDTLHLVLEALTALIRADPATAVSMEATVSPAVLNVWAAYVNDPLISEDALEILQALAAVPECVPALASRMVPTLAGMLAHPEQQPVGLLDKALDLLTMLLQKAPLEVLHAAYVATFQSITALVLSSDDNAVLQSGAECLAAFVRGAKTALLEWGGGDTAAATLLQVTAKLLDPSLESSCSLYVGTLLTALVHEWPVQMAPHLKGLVAALVARMATSTMPTLTIHLILVFARLVHMSAPNVGQLIDFLMAMPAQGHDNAFAYVMAEWTKWHGEIQGSYQIKVSTTALAALLTSGDPRLNQVTVRGKLLPAHSQGITTRSRAKAESEQWTTVPLSVKILSLLAEALVELKEGQVTQLEEEDDDEWEEVGEEDEDEEFEAGTTSFGGFGGLRKQGGSVFQPLEDYEDLLNGEAGQGDYKEDAYAATDPINQVKLGEYVGTFLRQLASSHGPALSAACQELTPGQQEAVRDALRASQKT